MTGPFLSDTAAEDLRDVIWGSFSLGLIGPHVFLARIAALRQMCRPDALVVEYCNTQLRAEEWIDDVPRWNGDDQHARPSADNGNSSPEVIWDSDDAWIAQFVPAAVTGLNDWYFRKGDPDPICLFHMDMVGRISSKNSTHIRASFRARDTHKDACLVRISFCCGMTHSSDNLLLKQSNILYR